MSTTVTITASNGYNERFAPAGAKKAYLAQITGRDAKMTFRREFYPGGRLTADAATCPVLVERRNTDKKGRADDSYLVLWADGDGNVNQDSLDKADAMWIAAQLDAGRPLGECWDAAAGERLTAAQAKKQAETQTFDRAVAGCWALISDMDEKTAKKVLAALKAKLIPKPAAVETVAAATESTPSAPQEPSCLPSDALSGLDSPSSCT